MAAIFLYPKIDKMIGSPNPLHPEFSRRIVKKSPGCECQVSEQGNPELFLVSFFQQTSFILNWPETLPEKKFGNIQQGLSGFFLWFKKTFKKKIIWVLHNKGSHHKGENATTRQMFDMLDGAF